MRSTTFSKARWQAAYDRIAPLPSHAYINNQRVTGKGERIAVLDPGTGEQLTGIPACGENEIDQAVEAAGEALSGPWAGFTPKQRGNLLHRIAEEIRQLRDTLGAVEAFDTGKPLGEAKTSVDRTADFFSYYAGIVDKLEGSTVPLGPDRICFTEKVPIGITGHITPWNVPISMVARGLAPALACGNVAVIKPAEDTPMTAILLAELIAKVGVPPGVVNVVTGWGDEAGQALTSHPDIRHLTFTGSVETGKKVMTAAATHVASVTLELGGKSPHLILADADLERALPDIIRGMYRNAGQICSAGTRLLLEESIHDEVLGKLSTLMRRIELGHGLDEPDMGPLISGRHLARVDGYVERAKARGIEFSSGGGPATVTGCEGGFFYQPSIAVNVPADDELAQKEIFGPVLAVIPVRDLEHGIEIGNATAYGLAAGIHTRDIGKAMRFARGIEAGQIYINGYQACGDTVPFGGMKDSGIGREKGLAGLDAYCQSKAVTISL